MNADTKDMVIVHLIGSPLALADEHYASKTWVKFGELPALRHPSLRFVHGKASQVNPESSTAAIVPYGESIPYDEKYDYLVVASGLRRVWPVVPQSLTRTQYLAEVHDHIDAVKSAKEGVVGIGGGAVGIELAAELKMTLPDVKVILVHSRDHLLS